MTIRKMALLLWFGLSVLPGIAGAGDPVAEAKKLFASYVALINSFDPAVADLYADDAKIENTRKYPDGTKKSVGVILPATLTFNTGAPEIMECVAGACEYRLAGSDSWIKSTAGEKFSVPGNAKFDIRVAEGFEAYHYICHFG